MSAGAPRLLLGRARNGRQGRRSACNSRSRASRRPGSKSSGTSPAPRDLAHLRVLPPEDPQPLGAPDRARVTRSKGAAESSTTRATAWNRWTPNLRSIEAVPVAPTPEAPARRRPRSPAGPFRGSLRPGAAPRPTAAPTRAPPAARSAIIFDSNRRARTRSPASSHPGGSAGSPRSLGRRRPKGVRCAFTADPTSPVTPPPDRPPRPLRPSGPRGSGRAARGRAASRGARRTPPPACARGRSPSRTR